jgi:hypothetical protein
MFTGTRLESEIGFDSSAFPLFASGYAGIGTFWE